MAKRKPRSSGPGPVARLAADAAYLLVWALILATPFVLFPTAVDSFRLPKLMVAEWLGLASLVCLALGGALAKVPAGDRGASPTAAGPAWRRPVVLAAVPIAAAAALGLLTSDHPVQVRTTLPDLGIGLACLVGWTLGLPAARLERLLTGLALPASATAALAVLQAHDLYRPFEFSRGEEAERLGVTALAGNTGDLAGYLVLPCLIAQWRLVRSWRERGGWRGAGAAWEHPALWLAVLGLCLYGLAVTQTLTALAAVAAGSVLFWPIAVRPRRRIVWVGAAAGALLLVLVIAFLGPLRERAEIAFDRLRAGDVEVLLTGRTDGWKSALWMLREHPAAGVGQGAYRAEFVPAKLELLERGASFYRGHRDPFFANAHNDLLEAGAEWGLVGLAALGWALWLLGRAVVRGPLAAGSEGRRAAGGLAVGSLGALLLLAVGHFPFRLALVAYPALLLLAWVFRTADERAAGGGGAGEVRSGAGRAERWLAAATALFLVVALVLQTGRATDRIGASKRLRVVEVVTARAAGAEGRGMPAQVLAGNLRLLREARRLDPYEVAVPVALGGQYLLSGNPVAAADRFREALELEPRSEVYVNLGRALQAAGRPEEAAEAFERAVRLDPRLRREVP